ncbi:uncharacterized protein EI90DRAFT_1640647 [Cantharellus anzutake]|uniref:uncharacterized protein n=1 Tax=Cantharellus anzutake TaxID=1750568 RepID=UPI0019087554|nr:uncharacterized protein EI90DRAFT_1640647 [Cantharellus anzutake]KAF8327900.1 hypothetical protein EI90DRAFT_1640647 [Cantharellus anzutake]
MTNFAGNLVLRELWSVSFLMILSLSVSGYFANMYMFDHVHQFGAGVYSSGAPLYNQPPYKLVCPQLYPHIPLITPRVSPLPTHSLPLCDPLHSTSCHMLYIMLHGYLRDRPPELAPSGGGSLCDQLTCSYTDQGHYILRVALFSHDVATLISCLLSCMYRPLLPLFAYSLVGRFAADYGASCHSSLEIIPFAPSSSLSPLAPCCIGIRKYNMFLSR